MLIAVPWFLITKTRREHGAETRELLKQSTMDLQLLNPIFHISVAHEPNGCQTTKTKHGKIKGNVWTLGLFSSRTSSQKPKFTRTCMRNNKNVTQLQCTLILGNHDTCAAIGINP